MLESLIAILLIIIVVAALEGLFYWGIGSFICWAFTIPFVFTFWHGVAIALIISILKSIFKKDKEDK